MRNVIGGNDPGVAAGNSLAVIIDLNTTYPENPTAQTPTLYTATAFGFFKDGTRSVLYTTALNPGFQGTPVVTAQPTNIPEGEEVVGVTDPVSFIQLAGIGTQ